MKRTKPMNRTGFKPRRPTLPRPVEILDEDDDDAPIVVPRATSAFRLGAPIAPRAPQPKREYVRSEALLASIRCVVPYCMHCGKGFSLRGDDHADPAHSNWSGHGKCAGVKADDNRIAALCRGCHGMVDSSGLTWSFRFSLWWDAHVATVNWLLVNFGWPVGVPVPDLLFPSNLREE